MNAEQSTTFNLMKIYLHRLAEIRQQQPGQYRERISRLTNHIINIHNLNHQADEGQKHI